MLACESVSFSDKSVVALKATGLQHTAPRGTTVVIWQITNT